MSAIPQSMRDGIQGLRATQSEALLELRELRSAAHEISSSLAELERIAQGLAADVERVRYSSTVRVPIVAAVHERVTAVSSIAAQVLASLRELEHGLDGWEISSAVPSKGSQ